MCEIGHLASKEAIREARIILRETPRAGAGLQHSEPGRREPDDPATAQVIVVLGQSETTNGSSFAQAAPAPFSSEKSTGRPEVAQARRCSDAGCNKRSALHRRGHPRCSAMRFAYCALPGFCFDAEAQESRGWSYRTHRPGFLLGEARLAPGHPRHCSAYSSRLGSRLEASGGRARDRGKRMTGPKTAPMEPKIVDRLLDLLGDSDKFRELFQSDPAAALELIGHREPVAANALTAATAGSVSIAGCIGVNQLASMETIQAARHELRSMLLGGLSQIAPQLDASITAE